MATILLQMELESLLQLPYLAKIMDMFITKEMPSSTLSPAMRPSGA